MELRKVLEKHRERLLTVSGVVGVGEGICDGKPCIRVFVTRKNPRVARNIPGTIGGYEVTIEETGEFKALS